jgi:20S proteasome alpha/beta subunit
VIAASLRIPLRPQFREGVALRKSVRYNQAMTIAAAFCCSDGVLMGADTLVSDGYVKTYEEKIFSCAAAGNLPVVFMTGAGSFPRIKEFADLLQEERVFWEVLKVDEAKRAIRETVKWPWYQQAIVKSHESGVNLEFLFALKDTEGRTALLHLFNAELYPVTASCSIGTGSPIAKYLSAWLYDPMMPVEIVSRIALQIFKAAKDHGDGCGGETNLATLFQGLGGSAVPTLGMDEDFLDGIFLALRPLIIGCLNQHVSEDMFQEHIRHFAARMEVLRLTAEAQSGRQSPTAGLSPEPPSRE